MDKQELKALIVAGTKHLPWAEKALSSAWKQLDETALTIVALGGNPEAFIGTLADAFDKVADALPAGEGRDFHKKHAKLIRKKADIYGQSGGD